MAAVERAAASGGLEIVETDDGELVAVDKDGTFYSTADSTGFVEHKPPKDAVDRLVKDLQQAEDARLKKRKERMGQNGEDGDVTYINEKNKQFNQKLNRFYNKVCLVLMFFPDCNHADFSSTPQKFGTVSSVVQ
jgi:pre-mRNA-splicing factor SYF2